MRPGCGLIERSLSQKSFREKVNLEWLPKYDGSTRAAPIIEKLPPLLRLTERTDRSVSQWLQNLRRFNFSFESEKNIRNEKLEQSMAFPRPWKKYNLYEKFSLEEYNGSGSSGNISEKGELGSKMKHKRAGKKIQDEAEFWSERLNSTQLNSRHDREESSSRHLYHWLFSSLPPFQLVIGT